MRNRTFLNGINNEERAMSNTGSVEEFISKNIKEIVSKDNYDGIKYLQEYGYTDVLKELISLKKYICNKNNPFNKTVVCVETNNATEGGAAEDILDETLLTIVNKVAKRPLYELIALDIESIVSTNNTANILGKYSNQVFVVENVKKLKSFEKKSAVIIEFLQTLMQNNIIMILCETKKEIADMLALLDNPPNFHFDLTKDFSFDQMTYHIRKILEERNFVFEKEWHEAFKMHLNQPAQAKKKKDYDFIISLTNEIEKVALTDKDQKKNGGRVVILKKYFLPENVSLDPKGLESLKELDQLVGMDEAKNRVLELIAYLEFTQKMQLRTGKQFPLNLHMMFTGSPGTGKTTIARIIAKVLFELGYITKEDIVEVDKKDLVSQWVGHTSIKTAEVIESAMGGVLFIDEAYSIPDDKYGADAIATLIKAMEDYKTELVVIVAGYKDEMEEFINANPGMKSRIGQKIHFEDYQTAELIDIYKVKMAKYQMETSPMAFNMLKRIFDKERLVRNYGNGRFVDNLIQDIFLNYAVKTQGVTADRLKFTIEMEHIPQKYLV